MACSRCILFRLEDKVVGASSVMLGETLKKTVEVNSQSMFGSPEQKTVETQELKNTLLRSETMNKKAFAIQDKVISFWKTMTV